MRRTALAAAVSLLCGTASANPGQGATPAACPISAESMIAASTSTGRVPRMGPGSDLLTQHATIQNPTPNAVTIMLRLNHRAFQQDFVAGQRFTVPANGQLRLDLGNVTRPGLTVTDLRVTTTIACG